jgi:hypothetical protein
MRAIHKIIGFQLIKLWLAAKRCVVHIIEEYARHNGHADLIRESINGHAPEQTDQIPEFDRKPVGPLG